MNRWLHIELDNGFYRIDCSKVTHVCYGGMKSIAIFTVNNQISFEFVWEDTRGYEKYKEYAERISDFIERYDADGDIMRVGAIGKRNRIKITKRDDETNINIS